MSQDGIQLLFDDDDECEIYDPNCIHYDNCIIGPCEFAQQGMLNGVPHLRCAKTNQAVFTDLWEPHPDNPNWRRGCPINLWI
jgi:hypothetical protein